MMWLAWAILGHFTVGLLYGDDLFGEVYREQGMFSVVILWVLVLVFWPFFLGATIMKNWGGKR